MFIFLLAAKVILALKNSKIETDLYSFPPYEIIVNTSLQLDDYNGNSDYEVVKIGRDWKCLLPLSQQGEDVEGTPDVPALPDPFKASARLNSIPCLHQIQDGRYWQYEFCPRKAVKQFHPLPPNQMPGKNDEYYLGVHTKNVVPYIVEDLSADGVKFHYLKERWSDGTVCDLNGDRRQTIIEYYCSQEETFESIRETSSCNYRVVVNTPKLCFHPAFLRQRPSKTTKIQCKPSKIYRSDQNELGPVSIETFMGFEIAAKKQDKQQKKLKVIKLSADEGSAQMTKEAAAAIDNILKQLRNSDVLAGMVDAELEAADVSVIYNNGQKSEEREQSNQPQPPNENTDAEDPSLEKDEIDEL